MVSNKKSESGNNDSLIVHNLTNVIAMAQNAEQSTQNLNNMDGFLERCKDIWQGTYIGSLQYFYKIIAIKQ